MMENLFSIGDFVVSFPLWIAGIFEGEVILSVLEAHHPDGERATVIFTDRPQVEDFLAQRGGPPGVRLQAIMRPAALVDFLAFAELQGVTHVAFDPGPGTKNTAFPIATVQVHTAGWAAS